MISEAQIKRDKILIRADADTRMGTGHVMRCIALAQAWQDQGGDVTFLSHCDSKTLRKRIVDEGFAFIPIEKPHPDPYDLEHTINTLKQLETRNSKLETWFVLDGYHFTPDYQKAIRKNSYRLLVIDDTAHLDHYHADILLNQNIHASSLHYSCDGDTVKLLGCEYVLLRREFLKYKDWERKIPGKANKILVTMGGSDPDNVTLKVIKALNSLNDPYLEVKIVAGPANSNASSLENELHLSPFTFHLLTSVSNMAELMVWADLAISAGGSTCWEMAFMGLPSCISAIAENQVTVAEHLNKGHTAVNVGLICRNRIRLKQAIEELLKEDNRRQKMSNRGRVLVDGDGALRVTYVLSKT